MVALTPSTQQPAQSFAPAALCHPGIGLRRCLVSRVALAPRLQYSAQAEILSAVFLARLLVDADTTRLLQRHELITLIGPVECGLPGISALGDSNAAGCR